MNYPKLPTFMDISSDTSNLPMNISPPLTPSVRPLPITAPTPMSISLSSPSNMSISTLQAYSPVRLPTYNPPAVFPNLPSLSNTMKAATTIPITVPTVRAGTLTVTDTVPGSPRVLPSENVENNYILIDKIGSGGQGAVYKAQNKTNGRIIALKIVNINSVNINDSMRELASLENISKPRCHPFLACYYNHYFDQINRKLFIEMEYIEGEVLSKWARKFNGPALHHNLILLADDLCQALSFIHSRGIIHRDIKPENIMISTENVPKLIDFGISCISMLCREGVACCKKDPGTLPYMAPETYAVRESYFVTDVWSMGVTLFVVATGFYPFNFGKAETLAQYKEVILNNRPLSLTTPNAKLNLIVNSCLNPNPATRITVPEIQTIIRS